MGALEPHQVLAAIALGCFLLHAASLYRTHEPESALWTCHVANLLIAGGLLLGSPTLNAMGLLWGLLGLPLWIQNMALGGLAFLPTSLLTHLGGPLLGLALASVIGFPGGVWWKAVLALAALQLLTRLVAPPRGNVNLAFAVLPGLEQRLSYRAFWAATLAAVVLIFAALEWLLRAVL